MPKVSVYLPDDLYGAARAAGLPISSLAQDAIAAALAAGRTDAWVAAVRARRPRVEATLDVAQALDEAREEFGA
jgi:post-segregation antitoxin (ccd killing protein)